MVLKMEILSHLDTSSITVFPPDVMRHLLLMMISNAQEQQGQTPDLRAWLRQVKESLQINVVGRVIVATKNPKKFAAIQRFFDTIGGIHGDHPIEVLAGDIPGKEAAEDDAVAVAMDKLQKLIHQVLKGSFGGSTLTLASDIVAVAKQNNIRGKPRHLLNLSRIENLSSDYLRQYIEELKQIYSSSEGSTVQYTVAMVSSLKTRFNSSPRQREASCRVVLKLRQIPGEAIDRFFTIEDKLNPGTIALVRQINAGLPIIDGNGFRQYIESATVEILNSNHHSSSVVRSIELNLTDTLHWSLLEFMIMGGVPFNFPQLFAD